jgi:prolyl 3-hydroxylase /prolyl 3,4-dihydroxylase
MLQDWISGTYLNSNSQYILTDKFLKAKPFPHIALKEFFNKQKIKNIEKALQQEQFEFKQADLFQFSQTKDFIGTKSKIIREFRSFLASTEFIDFMEKITCSKLKQHSIDVAGTSYADTDFLLCHDDLLEKRKIAFFLYLSTSTKKDGGKLNLYNSINHQPTMISKSISPTFNTFVFFQVSQNSFHQVEEVISPSQRLTISGWFHDQ